MYTNIFCQYQIYTVDSGFQIDNCRWGKEEEQKAMHMGITHKFDYTDWVFASFNMTQQTILRDFVGCHQVSL